MPFALAILAAALAVAVYFNSLGHPFVYDDHRMVVENPSIRDLGNWRWVLIYEPFRPLVNLSYALDYQRAALDPSAFLATNLALHALCTALFFFVVRGALGDARGAAAPASELPAFAAAVLFAVHPLQIEAAGYVSGRSEVLCGVFLLGAWLAWRRWALRGGVLPWLAGLVLWLLAVASKEVAAALPPVFALYDLWIIRGESSRRRLLRFHAPILGLLAIGAAIRLSSYVRVEVELPRPIWQNLMTQWIVIWRYLQLLGLPRGQSIVHEVDTVTSPVNLVAWLAGAGLLALVALALLVRRRNPLLSVSIAWFLLFLAPSSSLIPLQELMSEHRVYVAGGGFFLAIAFLLERFAGGPRPTIPPLVARLAVALILLALAGATIQRLRIWSDPVTLWRDAALKAPTTWRALASYAGALRSAGRCRDAVPVLEDVLRTRPSDLNAWMDLGICQTELGDLSGARTAFLGALTADPNFVRAYNNLGRLTYLEGRPDEARDYFRRSLELDPKNVTARLNLIHMERTFGGSQAEIDRLCGEIAAISPEAAVTGGCGPRPIGTR